MSARHVSALRRALRQCCGGPAARTVMVLDARDSLADPDPRFSAAVRVCAADRARLVDALYAQTDLQTYEVMPPHVPDGARCGQAEVHAGGESIAAPDDDRSRLVACLRQLADAIADRPTLAVGLCPSVRLGVLDTREQVDEWAALLGAEVREDRDARPGEVIATLTGRWLGVAVGMQARPVPAVDPRVAELERRLAEAERRLAERADAPEDPMASGRDIGITVTPPPPGVEGIPVSSPPSWSGRPVSAPPAPVDPFHVGRAFAGNQVERACGCKLAACGLVDQSGTDPGCPHHPVERRETMRQMHRASACPALGGPR